MEADVQDDALLLKQSIMQSTLQEVDLRSDQTAEDCCVICLDVITEPCQALPCHHRNFDYLCLASWLAQTPCCPLCKKAVSEVTHGSEDAPATTYFPLPSQGKVPSTTSSAASHGGSQHRDNPLSANSAYGTRSWIRPSRRRAYSPCRRPTNTSEAVSNRREIYGHQRFSKHVGSNRLSRYRELTPVLFRTDEELVSRARMFLRRELQVFSFLNADNESPPHQRIGGDTEEDGGRGGQGNGLPTVPEVVGVQGEQRAAQIRRRASNAEFLLEYIIAVLKSVDIMGSAGQAEEMLVDFLGRSNVRLFLHELRAWLRSPYTKLEDWDRHVQYDEHDETGSDISRSPLRSQRRRRMDSSAELTSSARKRPRTIGSVGGDLGNSIGGKRHRGDFYRPKRDLYDQRDAHRS